MISYDIIMILLEALVLVEGAFDDALLEGGCAPEGLQLHI